jgi:hypothetical protein
MRSIGTGNFSMDVSRRFHGLSVFPAPMSAAGYGRPMFRERDERLLRIELASRGPTWRTAGYGASRPLPGVPAKVS